MSTSRFEQLLFPDPPIAGHVPLTGDDLKQSGIEQAFQSAPDDLELKYINAINGLNRGERVTSETLRRMCGDPPSEFRNCLAGVLKFAVSMKLIRITGETRKAERTTIHAKPLSVYERLETAVSETDLRNEFLDRKHKRRQLGS